MTEKQLLKRLQYQQNRLFDIKGYSFDLMYNDSLEINRYFSIFIHDCNKNNNVIYHDYFDTEDALLSIKLSKLKDFVDELLNN